MNPRAWSVLGIRGPMGMEPLSAGIEWSNGEWLELWHAPSRRFSFCQWFEYHDEGGEV